MRYRLYSIISTLALSLNNAAFAEILTKSNEDFLCVKSVNGSEYVDAHRLREQFVQQAKIPFHLLKIAAPKSGDAKVPNANTNSSEDDAVTLEDYVELTNKLRFSKDIIKENPSIESELSKANERLDSVAEDLWEFLMNEPVKGDKYRPANLIRKNASETSDLPTFFQFFWNELDASDAARGIRCNPDDQPPTNGESNESQKRIAGFLKDFRIRGTVSDLGKQSYHQTLEKRDNDDFVGKYNALSAATVSFRRDELGDESTFSIKGALGFELLNFEGSRRAPKLKIIPYTLYERSKTATGMGTTTVHAVSPGLLAAFAEYGTGRTNKNGNFTSFGYFANISTQAVLDLEQEARKIVFRGDLSPTFNGEFPNVTLRKGNAMKITPKFTLIAEASAVLDPGLSAELAMADDYYGVGFDAALELSGGRGTLLENFAIGAGYRRLEFVAGDLAIDDATRFFAELKFAPPGIQNYFVSLKYEDGENAETFQNEEFWNLSLGVRY